MSCISTGNIKELQKFILLMKELGEEATFEKFEEYKNREAKK